MSGAIASDSADNILREFGFKRVGYVALAWFKPAKDPLYATFANGEILLVRVFGPTTANPLFSTGCFATEWALRTSLTHLAQVMEEES